MVQLQQNKSSVQQIFLAATVFRGGSFASFTFFSSEKQRPGAWLVKEGQLFYSEPFPSEISKFIPKPSGIYEIGTATFFIDKNNKAILQHLTQNIFFRENKESAMKAALLEGLILKVAKSYLQKSGISSFAVAFDKECPLLEPAMA
ncbi:MAG: hypothetical protein QXT25_00580 [Candidatus Anstonellaceae archaeon]